MGYQALLFCPDDKTARAVTQVLSELDFVVTPSTEPFAAVKKLMGEHFDAVVVDCDNEQNATLLFKSARNTANNQSALAVAVVEGQAGVAKAFRIGANLVLTKPINVEQAKGTLRVARGLLRKNEGAKPATSAAENPPVSATPKPAPQAAIQNAPAKPAPQFASKPEVSEADTETFKETTDRFAPPLSASIAQAPATDLSSAASSSVASVPQALRPSPSPTLSPASSASSTSAASAPAPAREKSSFAPEGKPSASDAGSQTEEFADSSESSSSVDAKSAPAPSFTFGGNVDSAPHPSGGGIKKALIAVAAVVLIATGGYFAWMHWGSSNAATSEPTPAVTHPAPAPPAAAPQAAPNSTPASAISTPSTSDTEIAASGENATSHSGKLTEGAASSKPSAAVNENKTPAPKPVEEKAAENPIVLKNNSSKAIAKSTATNDAPEVSLANIPTANGSVPPNLLGSASHAPTPVLQTLTISQGVSQGLLLKKVQPVYPSNALRLRTEGSVELLATISKSGSISSVKILSGDQQLARAALDAVKQWKYKPYLLNGSPVEIQTQITVNFKLPK